MSEYTDLRTLPDGTSFRVINGNWTGTVFSKNGKKYMHIDETDVDREITGNEDLCEKTFVRMKTITIRVPEKATNGDVIRAVFPNAKFDNAMPFTDGRWETMNLDTENETRATTQLRTYADWWNAPYKQEDK